MIEAEHAEREARAARLRERIYVAFVLLAVLLTSSGYPHTAWSLLVNLLVTTLGTLLAVFAADVVAHFSVTGRRMTRAELRAAIRASFGAITAIAIPAAALIIAGLGWWSLDDAVFFAAAGLITTLLIIGWSAIRRLRMLWWQRLVALALEVLVGFAVIALKTLAH